MKFPGPPVKASGVNKAFILGAGLGNRLRPLTGRLPKPLVPLFHHPLAEWAMAACARVGIGQFAINTHHLPEAWADFGAGNAVTLFHEPVLLETGGGLKNIAAWMGNDPLLVHNGDIFSTLPLEKLIAAHEASGLPVTLALRSEGVAKHIALDSSGTRVTDIRKLLGRAEGTHLFTGIYCVSPAFLDLIPAAEKISVICLDPMLRSTSLGWMPAAAAGESGSTRLIRGIWDSARSASPSQPRDSWPPVEISRSTRCTASAGRA